ncbi:unnamed protein product, partial [Laminaria digitata]
TIAIQVLIALFAIKAWSQAQSLDNDFNQLMDKSETYDKYKVVSKTKINELWGDVQKEISSRDITIGELKRNSVEAKVTKDSLTARINTLTRRLNESEARNGGIPFLGI